MVVDTEPTEETEPTSGGNGGLQHPDELASQSCGKNGWLAHDNYFLIVNDVVFEAAMYVSSSVDYV